MRSFVSPRPWLQDLDPNALDAVAGGGSDDDFGASGYDDFGGGYDDGFGGGFDDYSGHDGGFDAYDASGASGHDDGGTFDAHAYADESGAHEAPSHDAAPDAPHADAHDATMDAHDAGEHGDGHVADGSVAPYGAPDGFGGWDFSGVTAEPTAAPGAHADGHSLAREALGFGLHATSEAQTALVESALHANHASGFAATATKGMMGAMGAAIGAGLDVGQHGVPQTLGELGAFATKNAITVAAGVGGALAGGAVGSLAGGVGAAPGAFAGGVGASVASEPYAGQFADYLFGTHRYSGH